MMYNSIEYIVYCIRGIICNTLEYSGIVYNIIMSRYVHIACDGLIGNALAY
jgi:hypothetical protein